jgi:hypothetical protein
MTSSRYTFALALLVLTAVASAFQVSVPSSHAKIGRMTSSARRMAEEEDVTPFFASTEEPKAADGADDVVKAPARFIPPPTPAPVVTSGSGGPSFTW